MKMEIQHTKLTGCSKNSSKKEVHGNKHTNKQDLKQPNFIPQGIRRSPKLVKEG